MKFSVNDGGNASPRCRAVVGELSMMILEFTIGIDAPAESHNILNGLAIVGYNPLIDVAGGAHVGVRIHKSVALTFEDTTAVAVATIDKFGDPESIGIGLLIAFHYHGILRSNLCKHLRSGVGIVPLQPFDAMKQHPYNALFMPQIVEPLPVDG